MSAYRGLPFSGEVVRALGVVRGAWSRARRLWMPAAVARAERLLAAGRSEDAFGELRGLPLDQLGELLLEVPARYPALKAALPAMPPESVQRDWTGNAGRVLLAQSCAFVRSLEKGYRQNTGRALDGATILDYGCGWGRLLRLMLHFSPPSALYGVDAWQSSLDLCSASRVPGHLALCADVPRDLPFPGVRFDLVYAFSIFTHLSERTAAAVVGAIRRRIHEAGLLVLTVRPAEYWDQHGSFPDGISAASLRTRHAASGFAFVPHHRPAVDGEVTFGDSSISLDYVRSRWTEWELVHEATNRVDPMQRILFLQPR